VKSKWHGQGYPSSGHAQGVIDGRQAWRGVPSSGHAQGVIDGRQAWRGVPSSQLFHHHIIRMVRRLATNAYQLYHVICGLSKLDYLYKEVANVSVDLQLTPPV
jgi:hypothetical protein